MITIRTIHLSSDNVYRFGMVSAIAVLVHSNLHTTERLLPPYTSLRIQSMFFQVDKMEMHLFGSSRQVSVADVIAYVCVYVMHWFYNINDKMFHSECSSFVVCFAGRPLNTYQPSKSQKLSYSPRAVFNHTEDYGVCVFEILVLVMYYFVIIYDRLP